MPPLEHARPRFDLDGTTGFLVADARGRWRRRLVPADAIEAIDERMRVIGLRIERSAIRAFL